MSGHNEPTTQMKNSVRDSANSQEESQEQPEGQMNGAETQQVEEKQPRRGQRERTLTEKGREMQVEQIKARQQRFDYSYNKWKTQVKSSKQPLSQSTEPLSNDLLNDIISDITSLSADVKRAYDELRKLSTPDQDTRRRVDRCVEISHFIVKRVTHQLDGKILEGEQEWPEAGSLFDSSTCKSSSLPSVFKKLSEHSSRSSVKRQEAAAEAAASQAVLKVLQEQEREQLEIQRIEAEAKKKIADQEAAVVKRRLEQEAEEVKRRIQREEEESKIRAHQEEEYIALHNTLEEKRRKIQQLEAVKGLNAARARLQVYDQVNAIEEERKDILQQEMVADNQVPAPTSPPFLHMAPVQQAVNTSNESTVELVKVLAGALSANRIPIPEPSIFSGDPLKYNDWKLSFQTLIDQKNIEDKEKIYYLRRYVSGQAKKALDGYFLLGTGSAYVAAWEILEERYGNPFTIAKAYRDKLQAWPRMGSKDSFEFREFVDFLRSCEAAMVNIKALEILNDCNENRKILSKLPDWLTARWNRKVIEVEEQNNQFPSFSQFVKFLTREAKIACNPVTSLQSLKQSEAEKPKSQRCQSFGAKTLTTSSNENTVMTCTFCKKTGHTLHKCRKFMEKAVTDRIKFIQAERLCFGCLKTGHYSKSCNRRSVCDMCQKRHPTCLHEERSKEEQRPPQAKQNLSQEKPSTSQERYKERPQLTQYKETTTAVTSHRVIIDEANTQTAAIIPVWLSSTTQPAQEVLVYALLDSQSDTTFILNDVAEALQANKEQVKLKLSTMTSRTTVVSSYRVNSLQVRGFYSGKKISLPTVYTREFIPANRTHIPTDETAKAWPHLEHLQEEMASLQDCEVGLLIGYNCSQALLPREVVSGKENQPYAQRTDLGWSIVGHGNPCVDYGDAIGISHRIVVRQVTPGVEPSLNLKTEVHYVSRTKVKEITPSDIIKVLESDFSERAEEDNPVSQEDLKFLSKLRENITQKELPERERKVGEIKEDDPELRKAIVCNTKAKEVRSLLDRLQKFSDWSRGVRAVARLKRHVKEYKGVKQRTNESTSLEERKEAELVIIKLVQEEAFSDEIRSLKLKKVAKTKDSKLYKISPFLDEEGILRVGGRLSQATLHPHVKHPAILPKNSHISALLVKHFHDKIHHQGRGMTMNELRANGWWILGCSGAVSSHIFNCVKCRKYRRHTEEQRMGDLPQDRTEATPPFAYTGIDCFGPIYVKEGRKDLKKYGLLLTCLCSRAIHIEMIDDMTTDAFINALRAVIAIRGNIRQLRCDQGTNFVGARREFAELMKGMDQERVKALGCEFQMNPPAASHMGGVWERQIKTIRSVLTAILDQSARRLDISSLRTFLYEVMAIINSRPLTAEHLNDPCGPEPLTPNHILTMKSTIILPPPGQFFKEDIYLQKRWRRVQYLANEFWTRWKREYLLNLQPRQKWHKNRRNVKVNDIVLLQDDLAPRNEWKLARVTETYPGSDDRVRKLRLLVSNTTFDKKGKPTTNTVSLERPVHKVVTLLEAD